MYLSNSGMPQVAHTCCLLTDDSMLKWEFSYHWNGHITLMQVSRQAPPALNLLMFSSWERQPDHKLRIQQELKAACQVLLRQCHLHSVPITPLSNPYTLDSSLHTWPAPIFRCCPLSCRCISVMPTALIAISLEFLITSHAKERPSLQTLYESTKGFCRGQTQCAFHWESVLKCLYKLLGICHEIISALQFSLQFFKPHLLFVFFLKEPLYRP